MCQEVLEIMQNMDKSHVETKIALQCAPLITNIKISNLLIVNQGDEDAVRIILKKSGMIHYRLLRFDGKTTFLVFHKTQLITYLQNWQVLRILKANGYEDLSLGGILRTFQHRYEIHMKQGEDFPHEMGLLLGYPVEDVEGFIEHKGKNYLYSGYWKVYNDVEHKKKLFESYENAKEQMILCLAQGYQMRSIIQMYKNKCAVFT